MPRCLWRTQPLHRINSECDAVNAFHVSFLSFPGLFYCTILKILFVFHFSIMYYSGLRGRKVSESRYLNESEEVRWEEARDKLFHFGP